VGLAVKVWRSIWDSLCRMYIGLRLRTQEGQGLVEYALIIAFVAIVVIGVLTVLGITLQEDYYSKIDSKLPMK
jgi:Flp pilus assembly pilin Flp